MTLAACWPPRAGRRMLAQRAGAAGGEFSWNPNFFSRKKAAHSAGGGEMSSWQGLNFSFLTAMLVAVVSHLRLQFSPVKLTK